jgi:hypothetical protein
LSRPPKVTTRFRVVCSCVSPRVIVKRYRALADPNVRQQQLEQAAEPGAFGRLRILSGRRGEATEYGLDSDPYGGNTARNKVTEWHCPKCHRNASPTAAQADQIADACLTSGDTFVDLRSLV